MSIVHEAVCAQCGKREAAREEERTSGYIVMGSSEHAERPEPKYDYPDGWVMVQVLRKPINTFSSVVCSWACAETLSGNKGQIVRAAER